MTESWKDLLVVTRAGPFPAPPQAPALVGLAGIGLNGAGIFVTDPLNSYPPGTPLIPIRRTAHGILHDLFGIRFFLGFPFTGFVFAQRFTRRSQRGWAAYWAISGFAMFTVLFFARLSLRPGFEEMAGLFGLFQRITVAIGWAWLTLLAVYVPKAPMEIPNAADNRT